ncbi:MAG: N(G),N(G)-dimethylarginine dimethylaminohydrolase [Ardenticatenales bacterium]|nr:N(G),N(G)-dimethylarginine dimethylaminohydrolase [Ardenticatenales bacterium]
MFTRAIIRPPAANFAEGLTTVDLGVPDYQRTLEQHERYCAALEQCGLTLTRLEADARYPDSTFVEDTAILTERCAILTRPGAESRAGEVEAMREVLAAFYPTLSAIVAPGTVDGGDICEAGEHFFIGLSERTNEAGAEQLSRLLTEAGYTSSCVDIRGVNLPGLLHLKSGLSYLGDNRLVVVDELAAHEAFQGYDLVRVLPEEFYAANCVRVNDTVFLAAGYPLFEETVRRLGYRTIALEMSEFRKMDGGLSCLSLRL